MLNTPHYSREVAIMVTKKAAAHIIQVKLDPNGRYAILVCQMFNVSLTLVCVYVPPPFSFQILDTASFRILLIAHAPLLLLGDFNAVSDGALDRHGNVSDSRHILSPWLESYALTDVWRQRNPGVREYSCHSETHKTLSRIDLVLSSVDELPYLSGVRYLPRAISDHSLLEVTLDLNDSRGRKPWRMNTNWLQEEFITKKCKTSIEHYWKENGTETPVANQWDAFKATMRVVFATELRNFSKALNSDMKDAEVKATDAERVYTHDPSPGKYQSWQDQTQHYKLLLTEYTVKRQLR